MPPPRLAIILVNWNRAADTLNCLASLAVSTFTDYVVVVVDNGSRPEELEPLKQARATGAAQFVLIETGDNLGYTGGNNVGMRHALDLGAEWMLLLNNDTFVAPDMLYNVMQAPAEDPKIGILTPKILFHPDRHLIWSAGASLNRVYLVGQLSGYKTEDRGQFDAPRDLDFASGCAMFVRGSLAREIGLLCDDYFSCCEDIDYCLRAEQAGYRIRYVPGGVVWHIESASSGGQDAPRYVYFQSRNYFLLHSRWARNLPQLVLSQGVLLLHAVKRAIGFVARGQWRSILGLLYGIRDATVGKLGRREYAALAKRPR